MWVLLSLSNQTRNALQYSKIQADFVPTLIKRVTHTGIETVDGKYQELDIIICATGKEPKYCRHWTDYEVFEFQGLIPLSNLILKLSDGEGLI